MSTMNYAKEIICYKTIIVKFNRNFNYVVNYKNITDSLNRIWFKIKQVPYSYATS